MFTDEQLTLFCMCKFGVGTDVVKDMAAANTNWTNALIKLRNEKLIEFKDNRWHLTPKGKVHYYRLANTEI